MIKKFTLFFVFLIFFSCNFSTPVINEITTSDFKLLKSVDDIQIIDVRTKQEYSEGNISGAKNIDFFDDKDLEEKLKEILSINKMIIDEIFIKQNSIELNIKKEIEIC